MLLPWYICYLQLRLVAETLLYPNIAVVYWSRSTMRFNHVAADVSSARQLNHPLSQS